MSTCTTINQCTKCNSTNPAKCAKCTGNHTLDTNSNRCKCGQNSACLDDEMCIQESGKCVNNKICLQDKYCLKCSDVNANLCKLCILGYAPNAGKCEEIPCGGVHYCEECVEGEPEKCAKCAFGMVLSGDNVCECAENSGKGCPSDQLCTHERICVNRNSCFSITNCLRCDRISPRKCAFCYNGFIVDPSTGQCVKSTCIDSFCGICSDKAVCTKCQINLKPSPASGKCECVFGSETACPEGFICVRDSKLCVRIDTCMSLVPNCEQCWYHDNRKCVLCRAGFVASSDKQTCIKQGDCMAIAGCQKCVDNVPNLCEICSLAKIGYGESCEISKLSTGGIVGIAIAVIFVVGICVGLGVYCMKKSRIAAVNAPRDFN